MIRWSLPAFIALATIALPICAQNPAGKCDEPRTPIGSLPKGIGTIAFTIGKDGKPDTASIAVTKVIGMTAAGFHSVAARMLSACRFDMGKSTSAPTHITSELVFGDSVPVSLGVATPATSDATPLALDVTRIARDSLPLPITDRRVEERPRRISCRASVAGQSPTRVTGRGGSAAAAMADARDQIQIQQQQYAQTHGGTMVAQVLVGIDGKPGSQVRVISVSNPMAAQNLAESIGDCRFAPGRISGIAVPAYLTVTVP